MHLEMQPASLFQLRSSTCSVRRAVLPLLRTLGSHSSAQWMRDPIAVVVGSRLDAQSPHTAHPYAPHPTLQPPGMDLYFKRHDGCAVTCDDFLAAMADANGADLSGIAGWYSQAGTPHLDVSTSFNAGIAGYSFEEWFG